MSAQDPARGASGPAGQPPAGASSGPAGSGERVVLIGKPGCHLCDTARDVVRSVAEELQVGWREVSLLDDPELAARYAERIPVVLVDGRPHDYWRVDERRLRSALTGSRWWRRS